MIKVPFTGNCDRSKDLLELEQTECVVRSDQPLDTASDTLLHSLMISVDMVMFI